MAEARANVASTLRDTWQLENGKDHLVRVVHESELVAAWGHVGLSKGA
jgi:hypothetical protein